MVASPSMSPGERVDSIVPPPRTVASLTNLPGSVDARMSLAMWINDFLAHRREEEPRGDVVDAVLSAEIDGRPINGPAHHPLGPAEV